MSPSITRALNSSPSALAVLASERAAFATRSFRSTTDNVRWERPDRASLTLRAAGVAADSNSTARCGTIDDGGATGGYAALIVIALLSAFGLVGNVVVVAALAGGRRRRRSDSVDGDRCRRSGPAAAAVLFTTLAAADNLAIVACLAYEVSAAQSPPVSPSSAGKVAAGADDRSVVNVALLEIVQFAFTWGIWTIVLIAFVRHFIVTQPARAAVVCRASRIQLLVAAITVLSLIVSAPAAYRYSDGGVREASATKLRPPLSPRSSGVYKVVYCYSINLTASCLLPTALLSMLSVALIRSLRSSGSASACRASGRRSTFRYRQQQIKVTKVTVAVALINILATVPCAAQIVLREEYDNDSREYATVSVVTRALLVLNASFDCVMFSFVSKSFRRRLDEVSGCRKRNRHRRHDGEAA